MVGHISDPLRERASLPQSTLSHFLLVTQLTHSTFPQLFYLLDLKVSLARQLWEPLHPA